MKSITGLLIVILTGVCSVVVNGQTTLGVKGGVNIAEYKIIHTNDNSFNPRVSGHGGIYVNRVFNKYFAIQPEVMFSGQGVRYVDNGQENTIIVNYLEIPMMLQIHPVKDFYIEAGPQVDLLLTAKHKIHGTDYKQNVKADFATAQFSIATGMGFRIVDRISVYGRYNFGLTDVFSYDPNIIQHSHVIQVGVAVRLKTL